jgi:hypothetical protein
MIVRNDDNLRNHIPIIDVEDETKRFKMRHRVFLFPNREPENVYELVGKKDDRGGDVIQLTVVDYDEVMRKEVNEEILQVNKVHEELVKWYEKEFAEKLKRES